MDDAKQLWTHWQQLLSNFGAAFTRPGLASFARWVTGMVLCDEQHTITQTVTSLGLQQQWHNWERFAEYGAWDERQVERCLIQLTDREAPARFGGYRPIALDDTMELRWSLDVWGVCTFRHGGRDTNRPKLVRGHNWVVAGDLSPGAPWMYRPLAARLYIRQAQLPAGEMFHNKLEFATEMLQQVQQASAAPVLGVMDGGFARQKVVRPCSAEKDPIAILTRPRRDARLYRPLKASSGERKMTGRPKRRGGRPRKWGERLPSPRHHGHWGVKWREGSAYIYGQQREFRCKRLECRWSVAGPDVPVAALVFQVEGYEKEWYLVTTALELSAAQVVEAYAARFRLEDAIRDQKQRLGMEEVRAWTKKPVLRTFLVQLVAMSLLRLMQAWLKRRRGSRWQVAPPWNPRKRSVSILDLRREMWRYRKEFSHFMQVPDEVQKSRRAAA